MFKNTFGAKEGTVILTIEFNLFGWMDITESNWLISAVLISSCITSIIVLV
jgi:hypothetical protein